MKYPAVPLDRLPELPLDMFEPAGKLGYSEKAPVITIKPKKLPVAKRPTGRILPQATRSQRTVQLYSTWVTYPQVVCYPWDLEAAAFLRIEENVVGPRQNETDMSALAATRRYYKLSRLNGRPLETPWGCVVQYGPWTAHVLEAQSCTSGAPSDWKLSTPELGVEFDWIGTWEDIPPFPNMQVIMGALTPLGLPSLECCPGHSYCPTTGTCISDQLTCHDPEHV